MLKKISMMVLMAATLVITLPVVNNAETGRKSSNSIAGISTNAPELNQRRGRGNRNSRYWEQRGRRNRNWNGYRNYGQWRRTQNRRYRMQRSYTWRNGRRVSIWRRIFY